jgi:succinoglycan biosynthesis transport protein ExoP
MITIEANDAHPVEPLNALPEQEMHLSEYLAVVTKRRRLVALICILSLVVGVTVTLLTKPSFRSASIIDIEKERGTPADISAQTYTYDTELPTQLRLIASSEIASRAARKLNLPSLPVPIQVNQVRGTNLVEISCVAGSPQVAADIANAIAESYIDWKIESKYDLIGQATQFLSTQIEQLKTEIDAKEQQLQAYGRSKDIVSSEPSSNSTMQNLQSMNQSYSAAVAERVSKEARYHELESMRDDTAADTVSNLTIGQLRNDQAKLERDYAEKLNLYKPEWPAMQQLKSQIEKGRQHLDAVIAEAASKARDLAKSDYLTALRREESLKNVLQGQRNAALATNMNTIEYANLRGEVESKRALLDTLLKRNAENQVASRQRNEKLTSVRVIEQALPAKVRFQPSMKKNLLLALLLGLGTGIGMAFFLEYLDRSLRGPEQVERVLRLPALGVIPAVGSLRRGYGYGRFYGYRERGAANAEIAEDKVSIELLPHEHPRSSVAEAYRAFRTSLLLSRAGGVKTIGITSTVPAEGKTSTALNLSIVLGQLGRRVLIVDADLHKPRLHEVLRVSNRVGLVSILAENIPPTDAIVKTSLPNLFVVPSGPSSPNPSGLLSSAAMRKFVEFVSTNFDHVILDTPPVSLIADALMIGSIIDGIVLTIRGGKTPREQVLRVRDRLLRSNSRILGALINNLQEDQRAYGRYYAYYGYGSNQPKPAAIASKSA